MAGSVMADRKDRRPIKKNKGSKHKGKKKGSKGY